ncbi:MAG: thiamine phosphate synthase, partial [Proteobacteria bacterium]|nr:thiamine phosphate synthase [Pseudomonadota bacterium]
MTLSELMAEDARTLWATAQALSQSVALTAAPVSPRPLPPLLFFTDPERTPRPWETAARLPAG